MIAESSRLAVASLQIVDNTGEKRRVKEGSFSSTIKIEYEGNIRPNGDEYLIIQAKRMELSATLVRKMNDSTNKKGAFESADELV